MTERSTWKSCEVERDGVRVEVLVQPAVNLALVHNAVPLVRLVRVTNVSDRVQADLHVVLSLHGQGRQLAEPLTLTADQQLGPGEQRLWDQLGGFVPSYEHVAALDESHDAVLSVSVQRAWGDGVEVVAPVRVLAHNEWFNAPLFYESLAAFVQPNTQAVVAVLGEAADILGEHSGDASLSGYQAGSERASLIAAAVYEALRRRTIRYIDPPASFEETGQKVRTSSQVLRERLGTCVDLTVTYVAALEQAGLHPLVWLIDGHAFAGYLSDATTLGQTVLTEPNAMINLVESGRAVPVEAAFYKEDEQGLFAAAVAIGQRHFGAPDALRGVIDVRAARRAGTRPLPSADAVAPAAAAAEHAAQATSVAEGALALPPGLRRRDGDDDALLAVDDDAPPRVRQWKRALLDLSTRNRLLNLRPSSEVLDLVVPSGSLALLDDIVHDGKPISLRAQDALSDLQQLQGVRRAQDLEGDLLRRLLVEDHTAFIAVTEAAYVSRLRKLHRTARTMLEETGNANLYLTVGALVHRTPSGREARAPLFLLPVKIEGGSGRSEFQVRVDAANVASPNHCLIEWLRIKHGVQIEALHAPPLDSSGIDIASALPAIRDALVQYRLDARIDEVACLAICQFSTFGMWRDLERYWDVLSESPVVRHLALSPGESFRDPAVAEDEERSVDGPLDEAELALPIPADGSQLEAVALAAAGRSFVLEGPPGTGKSQTITNLVAHALERGKTVLFVAEKQAALSIVKRRLEQVGLTDFTLDLHGRSQRPAEIRAQLKRAIDNGATYDARGWEAVRAAVRARHAPLAEYPERVHKPNALGVSLWSAYENLLQYGPGPTAPISAAYVASASSDEEAVKDAIRGFARAARTVGLRPGHPWALAGAVADEDVRRLPDAVAALESARAAVQRSSAATALVAAVDDPAELEDALPYVAARAAGVAPGRARLQEVRSSAWSTAADEVVRDAREFGQRHARVIELLSPSFLEHGETAALETAAAAAQQGLFGRKKRLQQFELTVTPLLRDGQAVSPAEVPGLVMGVGAARTHAQELSNHMQALLGEAAPPRWNPFRDDAAESLDEALRRLRAVERFERERPELWERLEREGAPDASALDTLERTRDAWRAWRQLIASEPDDQARWTAGRHWTAAWNDDGPTWAADIAEAAGAPAQRWARMVSLLEPLRTAGLDRFRSALLDCSIAAAEAEVAYLRGVAQASLDERRAAGGLAGFDPGLRNGEVDDYAESTAASRREQRTALPAALLGRRPFQAERLSGKVAELRRRLDAKRGGLTFRQLMERYGDEVLQATPCFFVSPASLAQFVPPGSATFDIVVFDEASQVTVAQAIGALGRGRSAVIVGDSQQMPPTSVGKVRATGVDEGTGEDEDEEGAVLEDLDSILTECVESGLPRTWLSWHYRSQDETLIAFSNSHYYEGKLASLPAPGTDSATGVELRRVSGHFNREDKRHEHRTNRIEAEAIVEEIRRRLADPATAGESIGVVTFNAHQRDLVLNLLEECGDPLVARQLREDAVDGIFVKNLENVQGDERDVILFSVAFSKRPDGGPLPMNFGPLGTTGGEKRLNVAITRARRKIVLFVSFDPADIDLARTSSDGIAHLRAYLELAAHGPADLPAVAGRTVVGVDHVREELAESLRARGYEVETDYGLSDFRLDLVVRQPGDGPWSVAIVLDGPRWADRPTVADRELTPLLLEPLMRWAGALRVWLPEWIDQREAVLARVDDAMRAAAEVIRAPARPAQEPEPEPEPLAPVEQPSTDPATEVSSDGEHSDAVEMETLTFEAPTTAALRAVGEEAPTADQEAPDTTPPAARIDTPGMPYVETDATALGTRADLDRTTSPTVRQVIAAAVRTTVEDEGPITVARLARSVGRRFGFERVTAGRQAFILQALPEERVRRSELGDFAWPPDRDPATWRGFRSTPADLDRPLADIAPEEIVNAMAHVAAEQRCSDDESLFRATLAIFGQRRLTGPTTARLTACLHFAEQQSRLIRTGDGLWRPGV